MRLLIPLLLCLASLDGPVRAAAADVRSSRSVADTARVPLGPDGTTGTAFVAWPAGRGPAPAILVLHGREGLDGQTRGMARRLALQGYVAVAPDLGRGDAGSGHGHVGTRLHGAAVVEADAVLDAVLRWLRDEPRTARSRIGVLGFSTGGMLAQQLALRTPGVAAVVVFHAAPVTDPERLARLGAPIQWHFGAGDEAISGQQVERLRAALADARQAPDIHVYPGAGHSFLREGSESFRPDAARQAWVRTLAFLQEHVKCR